MLKLLIIATICLPLSQSFAKKIALQDVAGTYQLEQALTGECAPSLSLDVWTISFPKIPVLSVRSNDPQNDFCDFQDPKNLGPGYPSSRSSDNAFSISFGQTPEYDGPSGRCDLIFSSLERFTIQQVFGDTESACVYSR